MDENKTLINKWLEEINEIQKNIHDNNIELKKACNDIKNIIDK